MRRQHNPKQITTEPLDGEWVRTQELGWVPKAILVHCEDCNVLLSPTEIPDWQEGDPVLCGDCKCIRATGEQCDYSTENYDHGR